MIVFFLCFETYYVCHKTVADLRGGAGDAPPPPPGVQILSISCSFLGNFGKIVCWRPPRGVGAPSSGKSWVRHCKMLLLSIIFCLCTLSYATISRKVPENKIQRQKNNLERKAIYSKLFVIPFYI